MQVCNSAQEVECLTRRGKAEATCVAIVLEFAYLDLHVYLQAIIAAICSLRECVFMDAALERYKLCLYSEPLKKAIFPCDRTNPWPTIWALMAAEARRRVL